MRIALVWPKGFDPIYVMPLAYAYLKSNVDSSRHEIRVFDCTLKKLSGRSPEFENFLAEFRPDVVGVSCWSPTYLEAMDIFRTAKRLLPNVVTVGGGAHFSAYPEKFLEDPAIDFLFRGEADLSFGPFLEELQSSQPNFKSVQGLCWRDGTKVQMNEMQRMDDLDVIRIPDYHAIELEEYIRLGYRFNTRYKMNAPIWVTRGCPYRCGFCMAPLANGKRIRAHSIQYMKDWVLRLYHQNGIRSFNIIDDNFTFDIDYAKDFCRAMIALNLKDLHFGTPNGIRVQRSDKELFALMKKAGWENVVVAPESGSLKTLKRMKKDLNPDIIPEKVREIREAGLKVHGFFIVGYPGETLEDIKASSALLRKCKFNFFFINNFQPLPGTPIYDELVAAKEIEFGLLPRNYSDGDRVYTPEVLKDFNFPKFVLTEYFFAAVRDPLNFPYMLQLISPQMVAKKLFKNFLNMIKATFLKLRNNSIQVHNPST